MENEIRELKFEATPEKGDVSAILMRPQNATHILSLAHGAGSNMRSPMLQKIAESLADVGIAVFRYNFPYSENGRARDPNPVCAAVTRSAAAAAKAAAPDLVLLAGGHSFGGRMTSTSQAASPMEGVEGLVFFSFPLHPAGAPATSRADHLKNVTIPMLFLSGTRDALAELYLLQPIVKGLGKSATLHLLDTADHSYKILKRTRNIDEDVFVEIARVVSAWADELSS